MARKAKALSKLLGQLDWRYPTRSRRSDGWIGDRKHRLRKSDHNPDKYGVVRAIDITHDTYKGVDCHSLATALVKTRDPRIKYIIFDRRIVASYSRPWRRKWKWGKYVGSNPHTKHLHLSVPSDPDVYDSQERWDLPGVPNVRNDTESEERMATLTKGASGYMVKELQRCLKLAGHNPGPVDGQYGSKTARAVKAFQRQAGVFTKEMEGRACPDTVAALALVLSN